ncbi:RNA polymerase subunit sigma-70 [Mucilaginibacter sp. MD40]|uniref:RNA polymerase sigma-70 factor n=1 Tax=Mucilaginibacter sp. MD40 TaxID=2029590 RepID=UPI000BAC6AA4|nr:RNA polymerase sigma-70 factor [Mucilaginibacter sp. MD40]PAW94804.1 RNA polymerase subunit sigma-70 [Mucilaginibacter sp. MD40]
MVINLSEWQLIKSLKNGSEDAITEIYERYWQKMLAIAYNHLKDKNAAEEVVQQVFINLWDRRENLSINSLPNYLATAVKYSVFRELYRQKRKAELVNEVYQLHGERDFDDERIYARFLEDHLNGLVEQLPEKCRLVFRYSRYEGMNIREIARELNVAEKTVEAHLTKALKFIKYSLRQAGLLLALILPYWLFK